MTDEHQRAVAEKLRALAVAVEQERPVYFEANIVNGGGGIDSADIKIQWVGRDRPQCPVCGAPVNVERIDVTVWAAKPEDKKEYLLGGDTRCSVDERHDVTAVALAWLNEETS